MKSLGQFSVEKTISALRKGLLETQLAYISPTWLCLQDLESWFAYQDKFFNSRNTLARQELSVVFHSSFVWRLSSLLNLFQTVQVFLKDK